MRDPDDVIEAAEREEEAIREHYLPAVRWFIETPGLERREEVVADLAADLEVEKPVACAVVAHLVSDDMDPVQQVNKPSEGRFVGVISYAEHGWFYTFDRYDDVAGRQTRAVCARCVHEAASEATVTHYTRASDEFDHDAATAALGLHHHVDHEDASVEATVRDVFGVDPSMLVEPTDSGDLTIERVVAAVEDANGTSPLSRIGDRVRRMVPDIDVEPGASLVSGTTMGGNQAWHQGNVSGGPNINIGTTSISIDQGSGSGLNADQVDGKDAAELGGGRVVQRDISGNAYIQRTDTAATFANYATASSDSLTAKFSVNNSYGVAFLDYGSPFNNATFNKFKRNGNTITPTTSDLLITGVTTNDTLSFVFHVTTTTYEQLTGTIKFGKEV